jgi:hypothetical protein
MPVSVNKKEENLEAIAPDMGRYCHLFVLLEI